MKLGDRITQDGQLALKRYIESLPLGTGSEVMTARSSSFRAGFAAGYAAALKEERDRLEAQAQAEAEDRELEVEPPRARDVAAP